MSQRTTSGGVQLDMISRQRMEELETMEKVRLILDHVRDGKVVIVEGGLDPNDESKLVEVTMSEIDGEFTGIDIETYPTNDDSGGGLLDRVLGGRGGDSDMKVIGPANQIETLHKDEDLISTFVSNN